MCNPDDPLERIWQQYSSIKTAEQKVQEESGTLMLLDTLSFVTKRPLVPANCFWSDSPLNTSDFSSKAEEVLSSSVSVFLKPDRKAQLNAMSEYSQAQLALLSSKSTNLLTSTETMALDFCSKNNIIPQKMPKCMSTRTELMRLERLMLLMKSETFNSVTRDPTFDRIQWDYGLNPNVEQIAIVVNCAAIIREILEVGVHSLIKEGMQNSETWFPWQGIASEGLVDIKKILSAFDTNKGVRDIIKSITVSTCSLIEHRCRNSQRIQTA